MKMGLEAKVGLFVVGCLLLIGAMSMKLVDFSFTKSSGVHIKAIVDDASGLTKDAGVIFSGVEVGKVKDITLENGKAVVDMLLDPQYTLPSNLVLAVRSKGFLGEKYAELKVAGGKAEGVISNGATIASESAGTDFDQLSNKIGDIADDIKAITSSLRKVLATNEAQDNMATTISNIRDITDAVNSIVKNNENRVNAIMYNVDRLTEQLADVTTANAQNINQIIANINAITKDMRAETPAIAKNLSNITGDVNEIVSGNKDDISNTIKTMNRVTEKLEKTVDNINGISGKINEGKGTIGKLVNDETTVDNLNGALVGLKDTLGKLNEFKVDLAFFAERYGQTDEGKGHATIKITPSKERYYLLGLSSHPDGLEKKTITNEVVTYPNGEDGGTDGDYVRNTVTKKRTPGAMTFTAMYANRFWDNYFFRVGLKESEAGVGIDYHPLKDEDKLVLSADLFDFPNKDEDRKAHAKATAKYVFYKNLFMQAGYDNFLNKDDKSWFVGGGVQFRDDDLKYLLGKVPLPN
ncbi:MlaD family protein [Seleniivibrio woodruffii]|uniref:Phospholipid/cholesterol/gamma-HCH transport system substrate-binding protein n=1 Tax=Seleniivibrio woodruffii TaxID=1078050 RepID=A0A4R1K8S8_9BACT|nr:MlaD family protein [Seleniivibrio woodruffii]TCK60766.1 phospholipid/cholesterol/gamma-HCH transport system substrate-binding protein [Seleniivibrio woodruffii]TVZ36396.1 phospholipid/cholesterol/gamma-HCH transport system substrate-binding protein [Seleniivibrio woodruffii]